MSNMYGINSEVIMKFNDKLDQIEALRELKVQAKDQSLTRTFML